MARLLRAGHRIAYVAHATVVHSHDLDLLGELKRHFDIGYTRRRFADLLREPERDEVRGRAFARGLLVRAWREEPASAAGRCRPPRRQVAGLPPGPPRARLAAALGLSPQRPGLFLAHRGGAPGARAHPRGGGLGDAARPRHQQPAARRARAWRGTCSRRGGRLARRGHAVTLLARGDRAVERVADGAPASSCATSRPWVPWASSPTTPGCAAGSPSTPARPTWSTPTCRCCRRCRPHSRLVATVHSPMLADTAAIREPGARALLLKLQRRLFSRGSSTGTSTTPSGCSPSRAASGASWCATTRRRPAGIEVVPNGVDTDAFPFAAGERDASSSTSAASAIARACPACSRPSRGSRPAGPAGWCWPAKGR